MKRVIWSALILFMVMQLSAVLWQAIKYESIIYFGKTLYLAILPIDPYDAFRGRYIRLDFADDYVYATDDIKNNKELFVTFITEDGISKPYEIFNSKPNTDEPYLKIKNYYKSYDGIHISYPFKRFYMQEDSVIKADRNNIFNNNNVVAAVKVLDGVGVLSDIMINSISINKYMQEQE
ncbi:MAG: GDYXXLXY domain-containing protein [Campylobacteraceae bacterium]|jgi:uncharacterized membrane-anchored protein|nr:GDYXXLXY domain-containing protein [Campylobacteraceae bacterium]